MKTKTAKPEIKAVIFDLGNVLLNFNARKSAEAFAKACDATFEKVWDHFFTSPTEKAYTRGEITSREFYKYAAESFNAPVKYKDFCRYWNDIFWENEGMEDVLKRLKKNYPLYLISNTNKLHFDHIKENFKILRHFKRTFPSHEVGHRKPDPEIYQKVLKAIKLKPEQTVFVDDIEKFVDGARAVGMYAVQFKTPKQLLRDLKKLGITL